MWNCKNCSSENEDNFDICWSCGSDKLGVKSIDTIQEEVFKKNKTEASRLLDEKAQSNLKENKSLVIALSIILFVGFFMPWIKLFIGISAWDIIFGDVGKYIDTPVKYLGLVIPISGVCIFYGAALNNGNYPVAKSFLFSSSLFTLVIFAIIIYNKISAGGGVVRSNSDELIQLFSLGFWLTLVASIFLCIIGLSTNSTSSINESEHSSVDTVREESIVVGESNFFEQDPRMQSDQFTIIDQLERIQKMKSEGLLSDEDYLKMKDKIIASIN